jgi:hypothetical protein
VPNPIPINLVVEDDLSEAVLYKILESSRKFAIGTSYGKCGFGYIKRLIKGFNKAALGTPFLVLSDLEEECAPTQINEWLNTPKNHNLIFRIAVKEIESWLLADKSGFASFLNINRELMPRDVDSIPDPKQCLINLVKRSRKKLLREAIVPVPGRTAKIGPDYNGQLSLFVFNTWNITEAMANSESLRRAINSLNRFQPIYPR